MDKKRSTRSSTAGKSSNTNADLKNSSRKLRGSCDISKSSSHTQFYKIPRHKDVHERITADQYFGVPESMSDSSDTFHCFHKPDGKVYTEQGLLNRNILRELDHISTDTKWTAECSPAYGWEMADKLLFLVRDPTVGEQKDRLKTHLMDYARTTSNGYRINVLTSSCAVLDYLIETISNSPDLREPTKLLLQNMSKPIFLTAASDILRYFDEVSNFIGFLGYLLMRVEDDGYFKLVSEAITWHLSAPDSEREGRVVTLRYTLQAGAPSLYHTVSRMIAMADHRRFPTYMNVALLLACDSVDNCLEMLKENIIESVLYRFNPYFPERKLPAYDINPADPQDINVKLGASSVHMSTTLSLLLVIVKTLKDYLKEHPLYEKLLPCPDSYSQRCFIWAYRYECRARERRHQRTTLTVVAHGLIHCFGQRLREFSSLLMPDILTLSVYTEVPPRNDWTATVNFNTSQQDVHFKKTLIYFSVDLIKVCPYNHCMVEHRHWLLGLMYLLDPGLCHLRSHWSPSLYAELRKAALQAVVCTLQRIPSKLVKEYGLIRRIMWYIEWYSESPYEFPVLYWCVRVLQVAIWHRGDATRRTSLKDLFDTHGIIVLIHLCYTLLKQKTPPVERSQVIISLCLRLLTSAVEANVRVSCCVYPTTKWPAAVNGLARTMIDTVLSSLEKHHIINDRWLISLLNFIWEAIIWRKDYREKFIAKDGIYKLLDIITMGREAVQCIALAVVCDAARAGGGVAQLVTWRAGRGATDASPGIVKRGATIATLLAAVFCDACGVAGVRLTQNGVIEDLCSPIISRDARNELNSPDFCEGKSQRTPICLAAGDLAGSRMSKAFAILHMLSEDLVFKVSLADEAYNLYKNIRLAPEDEAMLVLCSHYLTLKCNEVWIETKVQSPGLLPQDEEILEEFLQVGRGWVKEIQEQQNYVIQTHKKMDIEEEDSLYEFLGRVRLNVALDALREVRCAARSADRERITHALLQDAVRAHHRRATFADKLGAPVLRTYAPKLDDQNMTGQNLRVYSISPTDKPKRMTRAVV